MLRKALHITVGLGALALVFLGPVPSALCALAAILFNLFLLPRLGGRWLWRADESRRGTAPGIVYYPLAVLILILAFPHRLEVVAATWAILAFGDGFASLLGQAFGRRKLPWNPRKSWVGSLAYWSFGTAGAAALLGWTRSLRDRSFPDVFLDGSLGKALVADGTSLGFLVTVAALAALVAAFLESQPQSLNDNLTVPPVTGLVLLSLLLSEHYWSTDFAPLGFLEMLGKGALVSLLAAVVAVLARAVNRSGAVVGGILATTIYAFLGWRGLVILGAFVALGSGATRWGYARKAMAHLAQAGGGRRGARHAVANAGVASLIAVFAATTPYPELYLPAFTAALAAALGDTVSSEIGQLRSRCTVLITTLAPVEPGTDGGISLIGSLAGLAGALAIAALGYAVGFYPIGMILVVTVAAAIGVTVDSFLGATLESRGLLDNDGVNFANTLAGALVAAGLAAVFG